SSDTTVIPIENISYTCNSGIYTLSITPTTNQSGSTIITVTIADNGGLTISESFAATVNDINNVPYISLIDDQTMNEDTAINFIRITVTDIETAECSLGITFDSTNITLIPIENISYTCNSGISYVSITPVTNQYGSATISVTITDAGGLTATRSFELTVTSVNDSPIIGAIADQTTDEDTAIHSISLTATDIETAACSMDITFGSSDTSLVSVDNISYTCDSGIFYISLIPSTNQFGNSTISITLTDAGNLTAATSFELTVNSINDNPIIGSISNQTTNEDTAIYSISLTATDIETADCSMDITFGSSDTSLVSVDNISYTCDSGIFYIFLTPTTDQYGNSSISITLTDAGSLTAATSFELTINSINDNPIIGSIS
ncbi:hypothetical protein MHK_008790, partial [Candidatus Magnetomorum sp. HK-1]